MLNAVVAPGFRAWEEDFVLAGGVQVQHIEVGVHSRSQPEAHRVAGIEDVAGSTVRAESPLFF
jgi:hypothetical protein